MKPFAQQTYYEILEVPPSASDDDIRAAHQRLMELYSPDSIAVYALGDPDQVDALRERMTEAMEMLTDADLRVEYDRSIGLSTERLSKASVAAGAVDKADSAARVAEALATAAAALAKAAGAVDAERVEAESRLKAAASVNDEEAPRTSGSPGKSEERMRGEESKRQEASGEDASGMTPEPVMVGGVAVVEAFRASFTQSLSFVYVPAGPLRGQGRGVPSAPPAPVASPPASVEPRAQASSRADAPKGSGALAANAVEAAPVASSPDSGAGLVAVASMPVASASRGVAATPVESASPPATASTPVAPVAGDRSEAAKTSTPAALESARAEDSAASTPTASDVAVASAPVAASSDRADAMASAPTASTSDHADVATASAPVASTSGHAASAPAASTSSGHEDAASASALVASTSERTEAPVDAASAALVTPPNEPNPGTPTEAAATSASSDSSQPETPSAPGADSTPVAAAPAPGESDPNPAPDARAPSTPDATPEVSSTALSRTPATGAARAAVRPLTARPIDARPSANTRPVPGSKTPVTRKLGDAQVLSQDSAIATAESALAQVAARVREARPRGVDIPADAEFNGELLRRVREARSLSIQQLADRTRISVRHLENVEADRYTALPPPVYLRGILMNLARELGLDPLRVSKSYLGLFSEKPAKSGR
ncbi:helix-turn-helix domain-containing protein [Corallococcus sp. bb12-1]|uniref:helix-turn-helix domain-containing protein n=1 Tax=Corallococcus sp. bb12-1 TaxID=2996784 RepID=UPI002270D5DE|nr:helix-turn-helix domain-containing protein [Corallococcus sp. bb12-1]MCY1041978.1 helix-turn-helix domain-containing protein [Corallococcus sp. bb12-1]